MTAHPTRGGPSAWYRRGLVLLGTLLYAMALWGFGQPFVPTDGAPQATEYVLPFGVARVTTDQGSA